MKLLKFTKFVNSLYPHEIEYLNSIAKFQDTDRINILKRISTNIHLHGAGLGYDITIDKRKYSSIMKWIQINLDKIDVDIFFYWMLELDRKIHFDNIRFEDEKKLLHYLKIIKPSSYYFIRFFEIVISYRDFILIRNKTENYSSIINFIKTNQYLYDESQKRNKALNIAATKIMKNNNIDEIQDSGKWEVLLKRITLNIKIDGFTRYKALIRLSFLYYHNKEYAKLKNVLESFDIELKTSAFYSKRILANYYNNVAILYRKMHNYEFSRTYGYYAIKQENTDFLRYTNNLCSVLLKLKKDDEALKLMKGIPPDIRKTASAYNRTRFMSFYMNSLFRNNKLKEAFVIGERYIENSYKEIINHSWDMFFSSYFQILIHLENYTKIQSIEKKFNLLNIGKYKREKGKYLPKIHWYYLLAQFEDGKIGYTKFQDNLIFSIKTLKNNNFDTEKIDTLLSEVSLFCPNLIKEVKKKSLKI